MFLFEYGICIELELKIMFVQKFIHLKFFEHFILEKNYMFTYICIYIYTYITYINLTQETRRSFYYYFLINQYQI